MDGVKSFLGSKTIWGVVIMAVGTLLGRFGFDIGSDMQASLVEELMTLAPTIMEVVGAVLAIFGRIKATKKIG